MNNIYLVGFMGTGKSSVARELAKRRKWQFLDLDELIQLKEKRTVSDIFAKDGESYFRRVEKRVLKEVSSQKKFIVACGGGVVIDPENIRVMKETGLVICLAAAPEIILKRTSGYMHRPLLNVVSPKKQVEFLLKLRAPYYAQAHKTIDTSKISIKEVVDRVLKFILAKQRLTGKRKKLAGRKKKR
jgi:shikimate kinase